MAIIAGPGLAQATGTRAARPPETYVENRAPTIYDTRPYQLLDLWLNMLNNDVYQLVSLAGTSSSKGMLALWVKITGAGIESLTGNSGGPVFPDVNDNINILGDTTTINVVGNPGTNTLTISAVGTGVVSSLTGNSGGAVFPTAGNTNLVGTGVITVVGNPGTSTLTVTPSGAIASSFPTDFTSPATPIAGVLNIFGGTSSDPEQVALVYRNNVHTAAVTNTVFVKLNESLSFPVTNTAGTAGVIYSGGVASANRFLHNYGTQNTFLGKAAGNLTLTTATSTGNTGIGENSLSALTLTAEGNTGVGLNAGAAITTGNHNTLMGVSAGHLCTSAAQNTLLGYASGNSLVSGQNNVCIGQSSGGSLTSNESFNLLWAHTGKTGTSNLIAIGDPFSSFAGTFMSNYGTNNTFLGTLAGNLTLSGANNSGYGAGALAGLTSGTSNTAVGSNVLPRCTTGSNNTGIGVSAFADLTTGAQNTALGECLDNLTTGSANTGAGFESLNDLTTGSGNQSFGWATLQGITTGSYNVACGYNAGFLYGAAESYNVILGTSFGTTGESNVMRLGNDASFGASTTAKTFISGVRGVTTDAADAIAVLISSTGQLGTVSSSARYKENIEDMGSDSNVLNRLRPVVFNYKKHSPEHKNYGLLAEEVAVVAPRLVVYDKDGIPETVRYDQLVPMLLNEMQKHCKLIAEYQAITADLMNRVKLLEEDLIKRNCC